MLKGQIELANVEITVEPLTLPNGAPVHGGKVLIIVHKNEDGSPLVLFVPMPRQAAQAVGTALKDDTPQIQVPGLIVPRAS